MNIDKIRENIIKEFITKEFLDDGMFPTLDVVCAAFLNDYSFTKTYESLVTDNLLINDKKASGILFNKTIKNTAIDLQTLYKFIDFLSIKIETRKNIINQKFDLINQKTYEVINKTRGLLTLQQEADGYFSVFDEGFNDFENIDTDRTNAIVDTMHHYAGVKPLEAESILFDVDEYISSISVSCLTPRYLNAGSESESGISRIYDRMENTQWTYKVLMPSDYSGNVEIALNIRLNQKLDINKLQLIIANGKSSTIYECSLLGFVGDKWIELSAYTRINSLADISFPIINTDSLLLKIRSNTYHIIKEGLSYLFFGKELSLGKISYSNQSTLATKELSFAKPFNIVALYAETEIPEGCSINYEIESKNGEVWSTPASIIPYNLSPIDFTRYFVVSSIIEPSTNVFNIDYTLVHPYNSEYNICLETSFTTPPEYDFSKTKIIRNLNHFQTNISPEYPGGCYIYIETEVELNFAEYPGYLDSELVSNKKLVPAGIHKFTFNNYINAESYQQFFDSNLISFGSHLASFISADTFINIAENNNYNVYTLKSVYKDIQGSLETYYTLMLKSLTGIRTDYQDEDLLLIYYPINTAQYADSVKLTAKLSGLNEQSPKLKSFKIKVG